MDFIVKLPLSKDPVSEHEFDSIFVVVDRFTKMAHFVPCNEAMTSLELASLCLRNIFSLHGLPDDIVNPFGGFGELSSS